MRVLLANLKHFYQHRALWLTYIFYGFLICAGVLMTQLTRDMAVLMGLMVTALVAGWIVAPMQVEVVSKAFSFALPGHRGNVRRLIFLVGLVIGVWAGWALAASQATIDVNLAQFVLTLCLGLCFTLTVYFISTGLGFAFRNVPAVSGFTGFLVFGVFFLEARWPNFILTILSYPLLVISLGVSSAAVAWWSLGRGDWFRTCCAKPVAGPPFAWDRSWMQERRQKAVSTSVARPHPRLDRSFQYLMHAYGHGGAAKHICGTLYTMLLQMMAPYGQMGVLAGLLLLAAGLWAGYQPSIASLLVVVLPLLAAFSADELHPSIFSEMTIAGGRRERFYDTIVLMGIVAGVSILGLTLTILALNLLMPLVPDVRISGLTLTFHRISLGLLGLPMIAFPLVGLAAMWLHGRPVGRLLPGVIIIVVFMFFHARGASVSGIPLKAVLLVTSLSWLACVLGIYRITMRSDLGRK